MEKFLHTLTLGRGSNVIFSYIIFSKSIFYISNREVGSGLAGIIFHLRLEGINCIMMSWFIVTDPFLITFYYVEKRNGILRKNRGEGFEKSYVPFNNFQNHPYVINEWPLTAKSSLRN